MKLKAIISKKIVVKTKTQLATTATNVKSYMVNSLVNTYKNSGFVCFNDIALNTVESAASFNGSACQYAAKSMN